jgi:hypothetical protein
VLTSKIWDVEIAYHKRRIEENYPKLSTRWCHDTRDIPCEKRGVDKDEKKEDKDKKNKSVAFKTSSSSKNKGKSKKQESSDAEDVSDIDGEAIALFVRKDGQIHDKERLWCKKEKRSQQGVCEEMLQV